ncbi:MAG: creatininase family protein [Myxococcota bacterium]
MPSADSAAIGRALLAARIGEAADFVARVPNHFPELLERPRVLPRCLVTTGIGTSEGHARHLAEVSARWVGQPARFATTGSLSVGPPPGAEADWLVVFSQGLSANARYALCHLESWGGVLLVTGLPGQDDPELLDLHDEKRDWLDTLAKAGVVQLDLGCGTEYGALLRVIGARAGYAAGWSVLRSLCARRLRSAEVLDCDPQALHDAQSAAGVEVRRVFPEDVATSAFFDADRILLLVAEGGLLELAEQLSLKIAEGMLRPAPRCVDVLHFAHGPLQSLAGRPTSILYLAGLVEAKAESSWLVALRSTLDPERHDLRVLRSRLPAPFSVLEYEAMLDDLVLRVLDESGADLVDWPGREREAALYEKGPDQAGCMPRAATDKPAGVVIEDAVWPEVEAALAAGRRTALIGLGSIEQHGPHLPLGTDTWIAEALARGLASRLDDAVALPPLAFGCAREHLDFPGTLHVEPDTLEAILGDLMRSLHRHGFERAFVWTAHGGNLDALESMRERVTRRAAPLEVAIALDRDPVASMQAAVVRAAGFDSVHAGPHAGEYETSVIAALRSGSVRRAALEQGRLAPAGEAEGLFYPSLRANAPNGVVGDPTAASADRGLDYLEAWLDLLEAAYRRSFSGRIEKKRQ